MSMTILKEEKREVAVRAAPVSPPVSRKRTRAWSGKSSRLLTILPPLLLGVCLLAIWYASTARGFISAYELPTPAEVWNSFRDGLSTGLFLSNAWVTVQESLGGFLLALLAALPLGYGLARWRYFAATVQPYLAAGQAVPAVVIAPFLVIWMGYGIERLLMLCFLVVLFPMVVTITLGFKSLDRSLVEAARVEGASFWPMLKQIEFPLALPAIMAALRTGLTLSITGALVGEFVTNSNQGLGAVVQIAMNQFNMSLMFATVLTLALMAAVFYGIAAGLTRLSEAVYS